MDVTSISREGSVNSARPWTTNCLRLAFNRERSMFPFMRMFLWLAAAGLAHAQYFPLQVGNQWIYRVDEGPVKELRVAEILRAETVDDKEYFVYKGITGETARIRLTEDNKLVQANSDGSESLWADFNAAEGTTFPTAFDRCTGRGRVESRNAKSELLDRTWDAGFHVTYSAASCADAGVTEDIYLPGIGLAERSYQSFTGPRRYKLTYARLGNASIVTGGEYNFRINLAQRTYAPRAIINLRLTLENWTKEPIKLNFTSGQSFDFAIRDASGETAFFWSANKLFSAEVRDESVTGEKNWTATEEMDLKPGDYVLEAWLTTAGKPVYKAQVPITVLPIAPAN
eukprot:TRINITY_DN47204_c0_g2_i2.p1 TRINITY_DN47204_c0_g2~~TRINITY_DN47204_c0_g2_i2.p1  ORF type:complete len:342 (+),score=56.71 TRINITY_DN47204_c0_g2_i2:241-1266(+)